MHSSDLRNNRTFAQRISGIVCVATAMLGMGAVSEAHAQVTSVPPVVFSGSTLLAQPPAGGSASRVSANQRGDVFTSTSSGTLIEIPVGTTTPVVLASNLKADDGYGSVTVDSHGNLWFITQSPDGYDDGVDVIPFVNGTYASVANLSSLPPCTLPANTTTVPCVFPNIDASTFAGGYTLTSDLGVDSAGDLYLMAWVNCFLSCTNDSNSSIVEYNATTGAAHVVLNDNIPNLSPGNYYENNYEQFVIAPNGDFYVVNGINLYYSAAGTGTVSTISGFKAPSGVSIDGGGNIYVTDSGNNRIAVLPSINGAVSQSSAYTLLSGSVLGQTPYFSVGIDGYGAMTYPVTANAGSIYKASIGGLRFGSIAVGSTSAAKDLDLNFTAAETYGSLKIASEVSPSPFTIATNGCTVGQAYAIGATCSVTITYKASAAGPQSGTLEVYSQGGTLLGTAELSGSGAGGLLNIDPGAVTSVGTTWKAPSAIAVDGAGNTYVADSTTGDIYENGSTTPIATGFNDPTAIVVDAAGDLYVGDSGNSRIVEVPYTGTAYGTPVVVETGLMGPSALAIDAAGNLYVADSGNSRVLLLASGGGLGVGSNVSYVGSSVSSTGTVVGGFTKPVGVAVDSQGNVYVADTGKIVQVGIKSGVITDVAQGLTTAAAVAVDPGGNLFYADSGTKTITRVPNVAGSLTGSGATVLSTPVVAIPSGLAVDQSGTLYAVDTTDATVGKLARTASTLAFGDIVENTSSSPLTATLSNGGTAPVLLSNPYETMTGSTDFAIQSSTTCANSDSLTVGGSCSVVEEFTPSTLNAESATLTFASNAGAPTLALSGTGVVLVTATITGPSSVVYGTAGTYSVSVTPVIASSYQVNFTGGGVTKSTTVAISNAGTGTFTSPVTLPAGNYTITLVATVGSASMSVTPASLVAKVASFTRTYGSNNPAFTCQFTSGLVNGDVVACNASVANTVTSTSAPGTYTITPSEVGAAAVNYTIAPPPASTYGVLTITQATPSVSLADTPASVASNGTTLVGTSFTFTGTVTSLSGGAAPTGTVTFEDVTLSNAVKVLGKGTLSGGKASITYTESVSGLVYIEALYSGDANYAPSNSIPQGITISTPTFTMAVNPQELIIPQGQFGAAQITITPVGNYTAPIVLSCSGLPLEASCAFSPSTVTPSNSAVQTVTLVVSTTTTTTSMNRSNGSVPWSSTGGGIALAVLAGLFTGWRRKRFKAGLFTAMLVGMLALLPMTGCGTLSEPNFTTPLGTYPTVTITGSSNSTGVVVSDTMRLSVTKP